MSSSELSATSVGGPLDPGTRIGHVHLKVADLERALSFYCGVLGFELMQRYGREAAFVAEQESRLSLLRPKTIL